MIDVILFQSLVGISFPGLKLFYFITSVPNYVCNHSIFDILMCTFVSFVLKALYSIGTIHYWPDSD